MSTEQDPGSPGGVGTLPPPPPVSEALREAIEKHGGRVEIVPEFGHVVLHSTDGRSRQMAQEDLERLLATQGPALLGIRLARGLR